MASLTLVACSADSGEEHIGPNDGTDDRWQLADATVDREVGSIERRDATDRDVDTSDGDAPDADTGDSRDPDTPDGGKPDGGKPDGGKPDGGKPDGGTPEPDAGPVPVNPTALSKRMVLGQGLDPDVAVDTSGTLHVVYAKGNTTFYRRVQYPATIGAEIRVGSGTDPQVDVDSQNRPHVVSNIRGKGVNYARWNGGGFTAPELLTPGWRKPRLAIAGNDRVFVTVSRNDYPRVILFELENGKKVAGPTTVGYDNNGAISIDSAGRAHVVWRKTRINHTTYDLINGVSEGTVLHASSDFSWCAVDLRDDSVHVVNTIAYGKGISYRFLKNGTWSPRADYGVAQVTGVTDADDVGPTIDVEKNGYKYIAFEGKDAIPYYMAISPRGKSLGVRRLDSEGGSTSGGKRKNPNVGTNPKRRGAFVSWGNGQVFVRGIGLPHPTAEGTQ